MDASRWTSASFFSPSGVKSLFKNFPDFEQIIVKIGAFGSATSQAVIDAGERGALRVRESLPRLHALRDWFAATRTQVLDKGFVFDGGHGATRREDPKEDRQEADRDGKRYTRRRTTKSPSDSSVLKISTAHGQHSNAKRARGSPEIAS